MADEALPRYQVGDQCYPTKQAAADAWIARFTPYQIMAQFEEGAPQAALVVPVSVHVPENGDPGSVEYEIQGLETWSTKQVYLNWYAVECPAPVIAPEFNATSIGYAFVWGLGAVLMLWALGYAIGAARTAVGKA
jgi:hypothetical protein